MACELGNFDHRGIPPEVELVMRVAVGGDQFLVVEGPLQRRDLSSASAGVHKDFHSETDYGLDSLAR